MLCSRCQKREANVHFEGSVNEKSMRLDLCEICAQESGVPGWEGGIQNFFGGALNFPSTAPIFNELLGFLSQLESTKSKKEISRGCPTCGWTLPDVQKTGKLGCSVCYDHFRSDVRSLIKRIHGSSVHKAKSIKSSVDKSHPNDLKETIRDAKRELERAVKDERFEEAARWRDKINELTRKKP